MNYEPLSVKDCSNEQELRDRYSKIRRKFFEHGNAIRNQASEDRADFARLKDEVHQQLQAMKELADLSRSYQVQIEKLRQTIFARQAALNTIRGTVESMGAVDIFTFDVQRIINAVATVYGLRASDIKGPSRSRREVNARRHVIHLLTTHRPDLSTPLIGKLLGGKDHATILHARKTWKRWEPSLLIQVAEVNLKLGIGQPVDSSEANTALSENIKVA